MSRWSMAGLGVAFALGAVGCSNDPAPKPGPSGNGGGKIEAPKPLPELPGEVKLEVADWDQIQAKIAGHKGKVVVLDIWSNWCPECVKEFPGLVQLQRKHLDDVACMSLNLNHANIDVKEPSDEDKEAALKYLKEHEAKIENYASSVQDEKLMTDQKFVLPAVFVYDREGNLARRFQTDTKEFGKSGAFTYKDHIVPYVEKLLAGEKP